MTLMLCVDEPYASAIFLRDTGGAPLKQWETRPSPPNGEMRPEGVRGLPGASLARGERIIIASTQKRPGSVAGWTAIEGQLFAGQRRHYLEQDKGEIACHLHPGHVVGSVVVEDVVPIAGKGACSCHDHERHVCLSDDLLAVMGPRPLDISDQIPWGIWTPGRWAWQLAGALHVTEMCPVCMGKARVDGAPCPTCGWRGSCDPIPVRGHQGLQPFRMEALR